MKKLVIVLVVLATLVSCGKPSPEEIQVDDCMFEGHVYLVFSQDEEVKSVMHDPICKECANKKHK